MFSGNQPTFVSGVEAASAVATDPFWSVVRRCDPDVDIVLLPPERRDKVELPAGMLPIDPPVEATRLDDRARSLWDALVRTGEPETVAQWLWGILRGTIRRETTCTLDGADPDLMSLALSRAADELASSGWHVLVPPEGIPRVMAGRPAAVGRDEIALLHVPARHRVVLRIRSGSLPAEDAAALVEAAP